MTRHQVRTILLLLVSLLCYAVAFLISVDWVFSSGNVTAWALAGAFFFVAGYISGLLP